MLRRRAEPESKNRFTLRFYPLQAPILGFLLRKQEENTMEKTIRLLAAAGVLMLLAGALFALTRQ